MISYSAADFHRESGNAPDEDINYIGSTILKYAADKKIGVLGMKALAGGLLCDKISDDALRVMVKNHIPVPVDIALRYVFQRKEISSAVVGMRSEREVKENCRSAVNPKPLTSIEKQLLKQATKELSQKYCRACHHCEKVCPKGIQIGWIFQWEALLSWPMHKHKMLDNYSKLPAKADACIKCGKCESSCPYGIDIRKGLERAHLSFQSKKNI